MQQSELTEYQCSGTEKPWEDEETIRHLYVVEGLSMADVAAEIGCAASRVHKSIHEFGIEVNNNNHRRRETALDKIGGIGVLRELYREQELTQTEIADRFGLTQGRVSQVIRENELALSPKEAGEKSGMSRRSEHPNFTTADGYEIAACTVAAYDNRQVKIHRLVAVAQFGIEAVKGMDVHHKNDIPFDNRPSNLELMTPSEHMSHHSRKKWEAGTHHFQE